MEKLSAEQRDLVLRHIGYARKLAMKFHRTRQRGDLDYEDFEGAAMLGLCDAARRYDPSRGQCFPNFSLLRIRGAMIDLLRSIGSLPRACFQKQTADVQAGEVNEVFHPYAQAYSAFELASIINSNTGLNLYIYGTAPGEEIQLSYQEQPNPEEETIRGDCRTQVEKLIRVLPAKERSVLRQYYFSALPYADMEEARRGSTKSWLSRLHHKGLDRMRKTLVANSDLRASMHELSVSVW